MEVTPPNPDNPAAAAEEIRIRHAEPGDFEAMRDLLAMPSAYAGTLQLPYPSLEFWKKRLADPKDTDKLLVAELGGKLVGHAGMKLAGASLRRRHAYMIGISVHEAYQRQGVGRALLAALIDLADNWMQATRLELTVFTDNAPAIALYQRFGFEIEGTHRAYAIRAGEYTDVYAMARLHASLVRAGQA